eukprot:UN03385
MCLISCMTPREYSTIILMKMSEKIVSFSKSKGIVLTFLRICQKKTSQKSGKGTKKGRTLSDKGTDTCGQHPFCY